MYYSADIGLDHNKLAGRKPNDGRIARAIKEAQERERREYIQRKKDHELFCQRMDHVGHVMHQGFKAAHGLASKAHAELCRRLQEKK